MAETDREMELLRTESPEILSAAPTVVLPVQQVVPPKLAPAAIDIPDEALAQLQEFYDQHLLLSAHRAAQKFGDFRKWRGARALVLAGRLASHLGAPKLASALMSVAWRGDREHPEATYFHALNRFRRRGPYAARQFFRKYGELRGSPSADTLSSWYAMQGEVAAMLRDFDAAEAWLDRAAQTAPQSPWVQVCRSFVLEQEDRYEEASRPRNRWHCVRGTAPGCRARPTCCRSWRGMTRHWPCSPRRPAGSRIRASPRSSTSCKWSSSSLSRQPAASIGTSS
jgi:hypothetical protein